MNWILAGLALAIIVGADEIMWVWAFFPIAVRFPKLMPLLSKLPPTKTFRFISTFFSTPMRNYIIRVKEMVSMMSNNIKRSYNFSKNSKIASRS